MRRSLTDVEIGDDLVRRKRYRLVINDDPSGPDRLDIQRRMLPFIQSILDQPTLLQCGMAYPERFAVFHNGTNFVLSAEAEVDQP